MTTMTGTGRWWRRTAGASLAAILMLALAGTATMTTWGAAHAVIWRGLPYEEPHELHALVTMTPAGEARVSMPDFLAARDAVAGERLAAASPFTPELALTGHGQPRTLRGRLLSADYFSTLGVTLSAGRDFTRHEETPGAGLVTILTPALRRQLFADLTDDQVIGHSVTLNARPHVVVGIVPEVHDYLGAVDLYVPIQFPATLPRRLRLLAPVARVAEGQRATFADRVRSAVAAPAEPDATGTTLTTRPLADHAAAPYRSRVLLLAGAALLVLGVAGVNFVVFLSGRASARRPEFLVRLALGARPAHIRRLVALDATGLCLAGGILSVVLTTAVQPALVVRLGLAAPAAGVLDLRVIAGAGLLLAAMCTIAIAASTRLRAAGSSARSVTTSQRAGRVLVILQVAASVVLMAAAVLLVRSYAALARVDPGFTTADRAITRLSLPASMYPTVDDRRRFWGRLLDELRADSLDAAIATELPLTGQSNPTAFAARTAAGDDITLEVRSISEHYLALMDIPVLDGRGLTRHDDEHADTVVVVNQRLAGRLAPLGPVVGQRLTFDFGGGPVLATIVGIAGDIRHGITNAAPGAEAYFAFRQTPLATYSLVVDSALPLTATSARVSRVLARVDPLRPMNPLTAYSDVVTAGLTPLRGEAELLTGFAVCTAIVAATGLYSLLLLFVAASRREWVIRLALGASSSDLSRHVFARAAIDTAAGGLVGAVLCLLGWPVLQARLNGLMTIDGTTIVMTVIAVLALTLVAAAGPLRTAGRVSAVEVFRAS